ncbi:MAG: PD-(D/E)XK nuclease family protein [Clostridiales bacterium]|nr:PD-(D/E)XK nuclease family protein [Clostridiales bacterium]
MSMRFILGRAGSGKTYYCLKQLSVISRQLSAISLQPLTNSSSERAFPGGAVLFILPEQATFIHERMLAADFMPHGYMGVEITSFSRLAWQAAQLSGENPKPALSEAGRAVLMGRILQGRQKELKLFGAVFAGQGLAASLAALAEEMLAYDIDPAGLAEAAAGATGAFCAKLHDLALLYGDYAAAIREYENLPAGLAYLAKAIYERGFLCGATVFVDGYSSFTTRELTVLKALMRQAARLEIALALDPQELAQPALGHDIFYHSRLSYNKLLDAAGKLNIAVDEPLLFDGKEGRFAHNPELALVERYCYPWADGPAWQEKPNSLRVIAAADPRGEIMAAGREIQRLLREDGLRYRDISIIARDLTPYEELLPEVFGELDIPYFTDSRKPLTYHPLVELFRSVLEIWAGKAHYRQIFRYFKTGLSPLTNTEIDKLENYCLAQGVPYWRWGDRGERRDDGGANAKQTVYGSDYIAGLMERGGAAISRFLRMAPSTEEPVEAKTLFNAVWGLFEELGVKHRLEEWQQDALIKGRGEEAAWHRQALERLSEFLAETEALLSDYRVEARQLIALLDSGAAALTLSLIPPGLDQVLVASLERSRNPEPRAVIVLGVNADILPKRAMVTPLLNDIERAKLSQVGIELAPDTIARQMGEHYLAYIALTRGHDKLLLTYATNGADGKALQPSPLIKRLRQLFSALKIERFSDPQEAADLTCGTFTLGLLAQQLKAACQGTALPDFWQGVYQWYKTNEAWHKEVRQIRQGLNFTPYQGRLAANTRQVLYGDIISGSVARLEKFNACPFAYFAAYGLKLKPRPIYEVTPLERGDIIHKALAEISSLLAQGQPSWQDVNKDLAEDLVEQVLAKLLPNLLSGILSSTARYRYQARRLQDTLTATLLLLAEQLRRGYFRPQAWEIAFGSPEDSALPPLSLEIEPGRILEIKGRIDRVDIARKDGHAFVRVIDYKSGKQTISKTDIDKGRRLQLPVYLETILANPAYFNEKDLYPAGFYYITVQDELIYGAMPSAEAEDNSPNLRMSGLTVLDPVAVRLADPAIKGHSKLIPVALSSNGFYANSPGLTEQALRELRANLQDILRQTALSMASGLCSVSPQRDSRFDACTNCDYRAFCSFDGEIKRWAYAI